MSPAVKWLNSLTILARTGGTKSKICCRKELELSHLPITSSKTVAVWGWMRTLLSAVQVTMAPWSSWVRPDMTTVLVTRPLRLSTSWPTADRGTLAFLQDRLGGGSPPSLVQYSFRSPPTLTGLVLCSICNPSSLKTTGLVGRAENKHWINKNNNNMRIIIITNKLQLYSCIPCWWCVIVHSTPILATVFHRHWLNVQWGFAGMWGFFIEHITPLTC